MPIQNRPPNPHDRFFRSAMQNRPLMLEFFEAHLPSDIHKLLDLDSIELRSESQVDEELSEVISDLVFSCTFKGRRGYLYILVEHQSSADAMMAFRAIYYVFGLIYKHLKQSGSGSVESRGRAKLPIVYPMVYYHGRVSPYPYSTHLKDCFDDPLGILPRLLEEPFQLIDLTVLPDEQLSRYAWLGPMAKAMKHIRERDITPFVVDILKRFFEMEPPPNALAFFQQLLNYVLKIGNVEDVGGFYQQLEKSIPVEYQGDVMSIAEQLIEKGEKRGFDKGETGLIIKMLRKGVTVEAISHMTDKPLEEIIAIQRSMEANDSDE